MIASWQENYDQPTQYIKKQRHHFTDKGPYSQGYYLSSSQVQIWELDQKEGRTLKNWYFWTVVLDKMLESPLAIREIKPVNLIGNQSWIFIGRTDAEAETPVLWPSDAKSWLFGKDPDAGKIENRRRREDEMVGWHHQFNGHELGQTPEDGAGQGSLECCSPWSCKESDMTWRHDNDGPSWKYKSWSQPSWSRPNWECYPSFGIPIRINLDLLWD